MASRYGVSRKWLLLTLIAFAGTLGIARLGGLSVTAAFLIGLLPAAFFVLCSFWVNGFRYGLVAPRAELAEESVSEIFILSGCLALGLLLILGVVLFAAR